MEIYKLMFTTCLLTVGVGLISIGASDDSKISSVTFTIAGAVCLSLFSFIVTHQ
jgi:hypothetical protein